MNAPLGRIIVDRRVLDGSPLTARERQVLACIVGGFTGKEIAHRLDIHLSTVQRHCEHIRLKTGAMGRRDLVLISRALDLEPV